MSNDFGTNVAEALKKSTDPLRSEHLDWYEEALGLPFEEIWNLTADTEDERPGWSIILDVDRCPDKYLPWLAQLAGVQAYIPGETIEQLRQRVRDAKGWDRGTPKHINEAATSMGLQNFLLQERTPAGNAWSVRFLFTAEEYTPERAAELASYLPAGIVWTYALWTGVLYQDLKDDHPDYLDVKTDYPEYDDIKF